MHHKNKKFNKTQSFNTFTNLKFLMEYFFYTLNNNEWLLIKKKPQHDAKLSRKTHCKLI